MSARLRAIKLVHTVVWAFFASCVVAVPVAAWSGRLGLALVLAAIVLVEVGILALNGMSCPLTSVAARYTSDREPNFDIYLPRWLARHNKAIFGTLYVVGVAYTILTWAASHG
jgi:hypothetical protein